MPFQSTGRRRKTERMCSSCSYSRKFPKILHFSLLTLNMYVAIFIFFFYVYKRDNFTSFFSTPCFLSIEQFSSSSNCRWCCGCIHHMKWARNERKSLAMWEWVRQKNKFMCSSGIVLYDTVIKFLNVNHLKCFHVLHCVLFDIHLTRFVFLFYFCVSEVIWNLLVIYVWIIRVCFEKWKWKWGDLKN